MNFDSYWSEEAWRQHNDPTYQDRFPTYGLVTKWPEPDESVVRADVDGVTYYWRAVSAFSNFVGNQSKHGKTIDNVGWQGQPRCLYAAQVAYIKGDLAQSEIPEQWTSRFSNLNQLNSTK